MPTTTYKMLGQQVSGAGTVVDLYTVPSGKQALANVCISNRSAGVVTFRFSIAPLGAADAVVQWMTPALTLDPGQRWYAVEGWAMGSTDKLRFSASAVDCTAAAWGMEKTP